MRVLYLDCFSGASGDMILGALIDAGVPLDALRAALGELATVDTVWTERVMRAGISATKLHVRGEQMPVDGADRHAGHAPHGHDHAHPHESGHHHHDAGHAHPHDHRHPHSHAGRAHAGDSSHAHRSLPDIFELIDRAALSRAARARARRLFQTLGEAESAIHGTPIERVHLHEVGAVDSIIDIVGTVFAIEHLGVDRVVASALNVGGGTVRSAHGVYPVPAPATLRLLREAPVYGGTQQVELVTPTGALLVTAYADAFGPIPPMRVDAVGYGAGSRDFPDTPNVLRVLLGKEERAAGLEPVVIIEAEIDDMNPQIFGALMDRLLAEGALDVFYTPIQMKKNRPGILLSVLATPAGREAVAATVFRETTTIGVRYREMTRERLDRRTVTVETPLGAVRFKVASRGGGDVNASPEFDDLLDLAARHTLPTKHVQAVATKAYLDAQTRGL